MATDTVETQVRAAGVSRNAAGKWRKVLMTEAEGSVQAQAAQ